MQIKNARFITSVKNNYSDTGLPEIAVCGKSNVGKSSLINYLTGNSKLAKISSNPGKTRLINLFMINEDFVLVDLPGYGYAKASKSEQKCWGSMIESYFKNTKRLSALLVLLDIRHMPTENDKTMFHWASHFGLHVIIVATKADKIAKTKRPLQIDALKKALEVDYPIVAVSSQKNIGADALLDEIDKVLTV